MRKYLWIIIVMVLAAVLFGGIALMLRSDASIDRASSPNGETEIIPDDPNEPWPDFPADAPSDAASEQGTASLPASSGTPAPGGSDASTNPIAGNASSSGGSVSSESSSPSSDSDISGSNSDSSVPSIPSIPDSGSNDGDSDLVLSPDGMHQYELPYVPLS